MMQAVVAREAYDNVALSSCSVSILRASSAGRDDRIDVAAGQVAVASWEIASRKI